MKRLLPFILLLLIIIGGIIAVPVLLLNPERHRAEITELLSKLLKRPVVVGPLSMSYFPPTLRLTQLAIMKDGGNPLLEIDAASAPLDLGAAFHLKFVPSSLQLTHWKLMISRKANGHWDIEDWLLGSSAGAGSGQSFPVTWMDGEIHGADPYANPPQELVVGSVSGTWDPAKSSINTSGELVGIGSPAHATLAANGQFFSSPQWSGDLQLTSGNDSAAIHLDTKTGTWEMKGAAAQWPVVNALALIKFYGRSPANSVDAAKGLELRQWQFHVAGNSTHLSFEHSGGISNGMSEAKGTVDGDSKGLIATFEGAVKDFPIQVFSAVVGEDLAMSGQVTGVCKDLKVSLSSGTAAVQNGQGYWELKSGAYKVPTSSIQRLARAKTMLYIKNKFPDLETQGLPITRLSAHWQAKDGLITVEDGLLVSTDLKAGWVGKIDVARKGLDATIRLEIHEKDPKLASLIPHRYRAQPAYGRLQGTWKEWLLRATTASRIPASIQGKLRRAITQK